VITDHLHPTAILLLQALPPDARSGQRAIGPTEAARRAGISQPLASYHFRILVRLGLLEQVPQNTRSRKRHLYRSTRGPMFQV
jgi:DNA-binding MarR family transcriptional regulator